MNRTSSTSFNRSLRSFLGASWLSRTTTASRIAGIARSLSPDPVDPVDHLFASLSENYQSPDPLAGFQSFTRQVLAHDALTGLIELQASLSSFDDFIPSDTESLSERATHAYRRAHENFPDENPSTFIAAS